MTEEDLRGKYPDILKKCWEVAVGPGWYPLIEDLLVAIQDAQTRTSIRYEVLQIKEKFGGLRFYYQAQVLDTPARIEYDRIHELVDEAERKSYTVCDVCGQSGKLGHRRGWYSTRCEMCAPEGQANA